MGKLYTIWSPMHRQTATASMVAMAFGLEDAVLTHTQSQMSQLETMLGLNQAAKNKVMDNAGMNAILYAIDNHKISDEEIISSTIKVRKSGLQILPALGQIQNGDRNQLLKYVISDRLPKIYDYVFVDLAAGDRGNDFELTKALWNDASVNFIVLTDGHLWEPYAEKYNIPNAVYILGAYHPESRFNISSFKFNISKNVATIPYCVEYYDAISAYTVPEFLMRNKNAAQEVKGNVNKKRFAVKASKNDSISYFFKAISEVKSFL